MECCNVSFEGSLALFDSEEGSQRCRIQPLDPMKCTETSLPETVIVAFRVVWKIPQKGRQYIWRYLCPQALHPVLWVDLIVLHSIFEGQQPCFQMVHAFVSSL
eukprot:Gregarina_sp_Poly_1__7076@NODE_3869_length_849_cov_2_448849_g2497_i0_p1_GENE_NODE_3869_length_849_cov_2_448849_g2497_i0NODE_3869_length_849_cov_2_448849_g2497_i0_p1_ORF_typecomplete_len103_score4_51_NODE_3869_length_849_cov_2_448849_g2497_i0262570